MIKVAKFGGTSVGTPARLRKAARSVEREVREGHNLAVVVSAMGQTTDQILDLIAGLRMDLSDRAVDEILSMGERLSARLLWSVLEASGVRSVFLDPSMPEWPIATDSNFRRANVDMEETARRCRESLLPMIEQGIVPVICGFLGRDREGRTTTLGRGASDRTAFLLGHCLNAGEVVIVTDVEGVMSADPRIVRDARLLRSIHFEELWDLSVAGAQVVEWRALRYKLPGQRARVVHYRKGNLESGGTEILGSTDAGMDVTMHDRPVCAVTIVGEQMSRAKGLLAGFSQALSQHGINIVSVSTGSWSISFFVDSHDGEAAVKVLHRTLGGKGPAKAVTKSDPCAMITITGRKLIYTPGLTAKALMPLGENNVNVIEVSTSKAEITIFVNWSDRSTALRLLKGAVAGLDPG